ncbi:hypothetical protein GGR50DRAFT_7901 [Xylaria sp. CBS 124048]|nr:hypothetical protein GGR50DRAFT_7901 [Xylaria sp. CBS 124048]
MMSNNHLAHATVSNAYRQATARGHFVNGDIQSSDSTVANATVKPPLTKHAQQKLGRPLVDMTRYPSSRYIQDNSLLSWMASLPVSPVPKSYSWSNEATMLFILTLCEAGRAGLIDPRFFPVHKQNRVRMWEYVRQRFCEAGLYALVPGLTDAVLESKYKSEIYEVFRPYKKLVAQQYSGIGFDMDAAGQFTASDELWDHHLSIKGNSKDAWLRQRGMPLWAQYEEAFGEEVATSELAQAVRQRERASWNRFPRTINNLSSVVDSRHNMPQQHEQQFMALPNTPQPSYTQSRPMGPMEMARAAKRRRETSSSIPDVQSQMAATLQKMAYSMDRIESVMNQNKPDDRKARAYLAIRRLKLGKEVEKAAKKALDNELNVIDVLEFEAEKDEAGLRRWCLEIEQEATSQFTLELIITPSKPAGTTAEVVRLAKRRRGTASSMPDTHEAPFPTLDRLESMLVKRADQKLKAYYAIRRLKLGKDVEKAVKKALENELNVVDVLAFEAEKDERGLREWCLEIG